MLAFRPVPLVAHGPLLLVLVVVAAPVLVCLRLLFNLLPVLGLGLVLLGVGGKRPTRRSKDIIPINPAVNNCGQLRGNF